MSNVNQPDSIPSTITTGAATVVADARLTLLTVTETFNNFFDGSPAANPGESLASLLPLRKAEQLYALLSTKLANAEWRDFMDRQGLPVLLHISATRIDAMEHKGAPVYHLVFTDLSELLEIQRTTAFERRRYNTICDLTEDIPFEYDFASDSITYAEKFRSLFGLNPVIPHFRKRLKNGEHIDAISSFFRPFFEKMIVPPDNTPEYHAMTTGGPRWFSLFCSRIQDEKGAPAKAMGALRDIDRQKREQLRLLHKSRIDAMTGLLNKTTTEEEIKAALSCIKTNSGGALLMIDLDNFKHVNDTMGHLAGDDVLIQLARQLRRTFRSADIIGRVGGDEFHVFMRGIQDREAILEKAQEICKTVRKMFMGSEVSGLTSISIGVACVHESSSYHELFRQADVALYRAKAHGKNRYEFFGNDMPENGKDQRIAKTSVDMPAVTTRVARNNIVVDIIDTLFSVPDMRKGIDKALEFIGNALRVDAILIYEKSLDLKTISITHEWAAKNEWYSQSASHPAPMEVVVLPRPATSDGIYYCSDVTALPKSERAFIKNPAVTSILQCDIVRDDVVIGLISFEERGNKRIWTQQEIDALTLMSKLISGNIRQTRSASLLRRSSEATLEILNNLPGTYVCVISKTHYLLYFNNKVSTLFPHARVGMACYELFKNQAQPCASCPGDQCGLNKSSCVQAQQLPFGKNVRVSISNILWENREAAYVALISEYIPTPEEREQQKKKEAYAHALCNTYDYVMDINSESGGYELLALAQKNATPLLPQGNYDNILDMVADRRIFADDRDAFHSRFRLRAMLAAIKAGATSLELEYRWKENRHTLWKNRLALPYKLDDGSLHILTYVRDITEQKERELRSREEEKNYLLALQSNYSEIFNIDLKTLKISPLYYNSEQVPIRTNAMDLVEFVRQRALNRVHPESMDPVREFYHFNRIRACIREGATTETEYRKRQTAQGDYRWIAATIRPVPGNRDSALLFLRDVTRTREEEAVFYTALKSSYDEIYEMDLEANKVRQISASEKLALDPLSMPPQNFTWDARSAMAQCVHPDDRHYFLEQYAPDSLRRRLETDEKISMEYRMLGRDDRYHWLVSLVLPLRGRDNGKILILVQDVTELRRMEHNNRKLERRYNTVFRQSCDMLLEADLNTGECTRSIFAPQFALAPLHDTYDEAMRTLLETVHPDDCDTVLQNRSWSELCRAFSAGEPGNVFQYRLRIKDSYVWMESRVFFVRDDGESTLYLLVHDISEQKRLEEERHREAQRFSLALQGAYSEIFELDIDASVSTLVFSTDTQLVPVGTASLMATSAIAEAVIHPDDREHVMASFNGLHLRACFEQGLPEVMEEFRRLDRDGGYHWVSSAIVPLKSGTDISSKAMLLVKDITQRKEAEQRQRVTDQYFLALRNIYDQVYEFNITRNTYRMAYHVPNKYAMPPDTGELSTLIGMASHTLVYPEDKLQMLHFFDMEAVHTAFASEQEYHIGEFRTLRIDGSFHWVSITMLPVSSGQNTGDDEVFLVFFMDIDAWKQAEELTRQNAMLERQKLADERYRIIVDQTNTLVFEWYREEDALYVSPELPHRFAGNYNERDIIQVWRDDGVVHADDLPLFTEFFRTSQSKTHSEMTVRLLKRDGVYIWCKVVLTCLRDENGQPCRYIGTLNDVDNATRSAAALQYRAEYDTLTGVCNASTFYERSEQLLNRYPDRHWFIIRMDIDRFKVINDLYGMEAGDLLLKNIARMLDKLVAKHGVCGRISGDVFCVCVDFPETQVVNLARGITDELAKYPLASRVVPSFGICEVENTNTPINVLCDWANLALKTIKGNVLVTHAFYDGTLRDHILEEKKIETEMHEALSMGQFQLYLQPKVHIPSSRIVGAEALARWQHPVEGLIPPDRFIPLFERNGFIINLDEYMWEKACMVLRDWMDKGRTPLPLSVNVSRMYIHDTRLHEKLIDLITRYRIPPHLLELELTESVFLNNEQALISTIKNLQQHGFICSLDDFGAGYSSLNMLKSLPIDTIKIDRGFLNEVVATERGKTIIRHTISLAQTMNINVIAEGVETRDQAEFLMDAKCSLAQGFFYSPPVPLDAFERMAF